MKGLEKIAEGYIGDDEYGDIVIDKAIGHRVILNNLFQRYDGQEVEIYVKVK